MSNKSIRMDPTSHDANHSSCGLNPPLPTEGLMSCPEESDMHPKKTVIKALINNDLSIIFFFGANLLFIWTRTANRMRKFLSPVCRSSIKTELYLQLD